ncbi:nucleotidyltransferase family protein [Nocardioides iriomotensis]|uniref:Nucleotidyltransferase family protein n=1 Tax=Nocardioides iriomotensis TaxID=715784 RepID=A0A4Q5J750_9ACTN|nr:nucleotidyltransferase family protein [Nocardioides iriomotensis]RYU13678.1 hypothetical protein ETU37_05405 [Nocardioides iriomotensis]
MISAQRSGALTPAEAVALAHPLVLRATEAVDIEALCLKGNALVLQGLREPHPSVDVDVLVRPADRDRALEALAAIGWHEAVPHTGATALPQHSRTLRHRLWPCEVDLHDRFPGFLADAELVFNELWRRRSSVRIGAQPVRCPDVVSHAVVAALHWLRDGTDAHAPKLDYLVTALESQLTSADLSQLAQVCAVTGANETLAPLLERLGVAPLPAPTFDTTAWRIRTQTTSVKTVGWVTELSALPWRRLPGRLWHALVLTEAEIRNSFPDAAPGRWGLFTARIRRLRAGLRDLPTAVRVVRRERRRS